MNIHLTFPLKHGRIVLPDKILRSVNLVINVFQTDQRILKIPANGKVEIFFRHLVRLFFPGHLHPEAKPFAHRASCRPARFSRQPKPSCHGVGNQDFSGLFRVIPLD